MGAENRLRKADWLFRIGMAFVLCASGMGCSQGWGTLSKNAEDRRLEVLTSFTLDLSKRDFKAAAGMLSASDRSRMLDEDGQIRPEFRERLLALRLTTLLSNPMIKLERGRVNGIYRILPVLATAPPPDTAINPGQPTEVESMAAVKEREKADRRAMLRQATRKLFASIRSRHWNEAIDMVQDGERKVFVDGEGRFRKGARKRLAGIDTASWDALVLRDGKLNGLVLIVPKDLSGSGNALN
jgi:hypothetical protein